MIRKAGVNDLQKISCLALLLWPGHAETDMKREMSELLLNQDSAIFTAYEDSNPVGFAQCQLRHDYVEGTQTSPVGYLEGIFVKESSRGKGLAKELLRHCEEWAKQKGCTEFASDCEANNHVSHSFHLKAGFQEANRIICFTKKI